MLNAQIPKGPLAEKWSSFGWNTLNVDGHNIEKLTKAMNSIPANNKKPTAVVADTIKGKGVSFMENDNNWHYRIPTKKQVSEANHELGFK